MGYPPPHKMNSDSPIGDNWDPLLEGFMEPVEGGDALLDSLLRPWKRQRTHLEHNDEFEDDNLRFTNPFTAQPQRKQLPPAGDYLLHDACRVWSSNASVIEIAMGAFPQQECLKRWIDPTPKSKLFQLPLNLALQHKAPTKVILVLLSAAPAALTMPDGPKLDQVTFTLALSIMPRETDLLLGLLQSAPSVAFHQDRNGSLPLHIAASKGKLVDVEVLQALVQLNPQALLHRNWIDETPVDVARRTINCTPKAFGYLQRNQKTLYTKRAAKNLKHSTRIQLQLRKGLSAALNK